MTVLPPATEDYKLWVLLHQTKDAIHHNREKELALCGLSPIMAATLFIVQAIGDKATPAEIARWLFRQPHSVTGLLNRMVKEGLITKTKDLDKKNLVRISITEKGKTAYEQSRNHESISRILSVLSGEEREQLRVSLDKLRKKALEELELEKKLPYP